MMAIIGFLAVLMAAGFLCFAAFFHLRFMMAFTGKFSWPAAITFLFGVALVWLDFHYAPFEVALKVVTP